jgi:D-hydroxyproline dehydrogenase subunit beta
MSAATADVAIVGGGIVGAACARALTLDKFRVTLIECGDAGCGGATAAGMGHIVVMDDSEAQFALTGYSARLWTELRPALPETVEFASCGTLWIAADADELAAVDP